MPFIRNCLYLAAYVVLGLLGSLFLFISKTKVCCIQYFAWLQWLIHVWDMLASPDMMLTDFLSVLAGWTGQIRLRLLQLQKSHTGGHPISRETSCPKKTAPTGLQTWARPQRGTWAVVLRLPLETLGAAPCVCSIHPITAEACSAEAACWCGPYSAKRAGSTACPSPDRWYTRLI